MIIRLIEMLIVLLSNIEIKKLQVQVALQLHMGHLKK